MNEEDFSKELAKEDLECFLKFCKSYDDYKIHYLACLVWDPEYSHPTSYMLNCLSKWIRDNYTKYAENENTEYSTYLYLLSKILEENEELNLHSGNARRVWEKYILNFIKEKKVNFARLFIEEKKNFKPNWDNLVVR